MSGSIANATRLFHEIDSALETDSVSRALRLILSNFSHFPDTAPLRERVAQALITRGRKREAVQILELVARHFANSGQPTRCLAAIKQMNALQPDATVLLDHFSALYSIRSPYLAEAPGVPDLQLPEEELDLSAKEPSVGEPELFELAVERSLQKAGMIAQPQELPALPLLSLLPTETLRRVLDHIDYEVFAQRQKMLAKGSYSDDLVWTVTSDLLVKDIGRDHRVPSGALLGLNGFGRPRMTNEFDVEASPSSEILRLNADAIVALNETFGDFANRLATLRRHALIERLYCSHPLFEEITDGAERRDLLERFTGVHVGRKEHLIRQAEPSPGLYIMLDGNVDIVRKDGDWEITVATLGAGEVFGEVGLVSDQPAVAGVVATTPSILLFLPREAFDVAARQHPALARYTAQLAQKRLDDVNTTLSASDLAELE